MSNNNKDNRVTRFKESTRALNEQFSRWIVDQIQKKPEKLLTAGVSDYLRHCAKLRFQFSDLISEEEDEETLGDATDRPLLLSRRGCIFPLSLAPFQQTKVVHFVRHGQGFHNVGISNMDAKLTEIGWKQAHALGSHMRRFPVTSSVQLVVSSPLTRACQTAAGIFGDSEVKRDDGAVLMEEQKDVPNTSVAHATIMCQDNLRFIVNESCRERLGPSNCDARRCKDELQLEYPGMDFSSLPIGPDPFWVQGKVEDEASVAARGQMFLQFLMDQPETNIAVVTHSAFLWFTLACFGNDLSKQVRDYLQRWFENCEMRSVVLTSGGSLKLLSSSDFQGGHDVITEPQQELLTEEERKRT